MIRLLRFRANQKREREQALLQELLQAPVPTDDAQLRPVVLSSVEEQRRMALSPFLLRTWVDHALFRVERGLILVLILFLGFWFITGYGRDWLHQSHTPATPGEHPGNERAAAAHPGNTAWQGHNTHAPVAPALPFEAATTANPSRAGGAAKSTEHTAPDYLDPHTILPPPQLADQQPQRLVMPTIDVDTAVNEVFIEHGVWQVADYAAGYHHGTALPGERGNTVISGHAGLHGAVFRDLGALAVGDEVFIEAGGWRYRYQVREQKSVWPQQIEVMEPTPTAVLTLITCTAWDTQRLVVIADLVDSHPL